VVSVLNFKPANRGSIRGFFDLRYHGLVIKSCRLMDGNNGLWFVFPQIKDEENGEVRYFDQMFLTSPEREHIRKLVLIDLQQQGHIKDEGLSGRHSTGQNDENIPF
jgi:DNA-binding cell septation regulator SpoVG